MIRIPPDADINTRTAFEDIQRELENLRSERTVAVRPDEEERKSVAIRDQNDVEMADSLTVEGDIEVRGDVDIPHLHEGLIKVVPATAEEPQRVINMQASLAIAPGNLSADTVRCRELDLDNLFALAPDSRYSFMSDDFIFSGPTAITDDGLVGSLNWNLAANAGGTATLFTGDDKHPGAIYLTPNDSAGNYASMYANNAAFTLLNGVEDYREEWWIQNHGGAVADADLRFGLVSNVTFGVVVSGIYFQLDNSVSGDSNFYAYTTAASTSTSTDTGVAFSAGAWNNFRVHYTPESVKFYINGSLVATHTSNIPTGQDMTPVISTTRANVQRNFPIVDYYSLALRVAR